MPDTDSVRPLITIGITSYNAEKTIDRAFQSALGQTWRPIEIVLVDDASSDDTKGIVSRMVANHPEARLIAFKENRGVAAARNAILGAAQGEFVAFFDDDDESVPERLGRQYERIVDYERAWNTHMVICHSTRQQYWPDGSARIEPTMGCEVGVAAPSGHRVAERILIGRPSPGVFGSCATCSQMARLSVYKRAGGFHELLRRGEDTDLNIRLAQLGTHFVGVYEPLVIQHMNLTGDKDPETERRNQLALLNHHRAFLEEMGWYRFCVDWLDMKYDYLMARRARSLYKAIKLVISCPAKTMQRALWVWPNIQFNRSMQAFYKSAKNLAE